MKKYRFWILTLAVLGGIGYWFYMGITKPLPGEVVKEIGGGKLSQEHLTDIGGIVYTSNPPAGGPHFPLWAKPGVYDRFISDGYLIHSMEHGYIIIWYDCGTETSAQEEASQSAKPLTKMTAQVTSGTSWITPQNPPEVEVELPEAFKTESCQNLVSALLPFTKIAQRVIMVPKQDMDTPIALTAWENISKLGSVDKEAIENFINTFHNRGPEQTME